MSVPIVIAVTGAILIALLIAWSRLGRVHYDSTKHAEGRTDEKEDTEQKS